MTSDLNADEAQDYFDPTQNGNPTTDERASYAYDALFNAPDFSTLVKGRRTPHAREYETKVKSVLKSGTIASLRNNQLADAATILRHGPGFAAATGDLCAANEKAAKAVDLLTSPENPYFSFVFAGLPFVAQLLRNHEQTLEGIPVARKQAKQRRKEAKAQAQEDSRRVATLHIPFMRREIKVRLGLKINPFRNLRGGLRASTQPPEQLVTIVFSDPKLQDALAKMDIKIVQVQEPM